MVAHGKGFLVAVWVIVIPTFIIDVVFIINIINRADSSRKAHTENGDQVSILNYATFR